MNDDTPGQEPAASTPPVPPPAASTSATPLNEPPGSPYVVLEKLARDLLDEQRMNRRWRVFFRFSALILAFIAVWAAFDFKGTTKQVNSRHTALIEIDGEIDSASSTGEKPVYVVIEDMCASGCYYIAAAADKIYVSQASIVGSIGVLMSSFGFTGLMEKLGVERRLMTAGENKGIMDPFSPYSAKHKEFTQAMLKEIHEQFIAAVRKGRGKRLKENPEIFSGLFWTGSRAITLGLADGLGTVDTVARDVLKAEDVIDYTVREGLSDRVLKKFGAAIGEGAARVVSNDWMKPR
ncbi:MAG: S49 family peptidase [Oxalobacteraceae bacterium]|nr:S49 family peptidase [Oxalobacteraceae bacterium]